MYPDPKRIRSHRITVCLDEYEHDLLTALANYQGEPFSKLLRVLVMREAQQLLLGSGDSVEQSAA
ncbi:hypothetical protein [Polaromonas naphthalenivorans]|uniref:hypothetical protein n=1 Tax=Polaromonas naphthalenivorans TaxID=216465 RepID=UPI00030C5D1A|nr:hypothetical protein [Polaromonas naphthalenivorans]